MAAPTRARHQRADQGQAWDRYLEAASGVTRRPLSIRSRPPSGVAPASENHAGIDPAEAEPVRDCVFEAGVPCGRTDDIKAATMLVRLFEVQGRWRQLILERLDGKNRLDRASGAQRVTCRRLGRADREQR